MAAGAPVGFLLARGQITWVFILWVAVLMPAAALYGYFYLCAGKPMPPKQQQLANMITVLLVLLWLGITTADTIEVELWPPVFPSVATLAVALLLLTGGMLGPAVRGWNRVAEEHKKRLRSFLPEKALHLPAWFLVSLLAGVGEEIGYRGVLVQLLLGWSDSWAIAFPISCLLFALAHLAQGPRAALVIFIFAIQFHILVALAGTLYVAMLVHFLYDFLFGIFAMKQFQKEAAAQPLPQAQAAQA